MMNRVKFPKRRADGSFCVEIRISVKTKGPEELLHQVQEWAIKWAETNQVWIWMGGTMTLQYKQEFKQEPQPIFCSFSELIIRMEGQSSATNMWKDWIVYRILPDLREAFTEIHDFINISDCDESL